jgi:CcmD family protein
MKGLSEFILGYIVIWLGIFGYMVYLNLKQRKLDKEIETLKGIADEHGKGQ